MSERGRYKVFLGMAPGVGKTYRMLQEGRAARDAGRDVVIGILETHNRAETAEQAEGLEQLPRRRVNYRETVIEEMDLPAIFRRAPELCLVDELAHTNAPGLENTKRHQDIDDVLDAGIDVYSTVNIQHLETLNDRVAELTGVRVRETFPDSVLNSADEVVLVDLTPEALVQRLREGKVYEGPRAVAALQNFFRVQNLATLRELALREVAEDVEHRRSAPDPLGPADDEGAPAVRERLLVLVTPNPTSEAVLRSAWRSAERLGGELDALYVIGPGDAPRGDRREQLERLRRLASTLGIELNVEEGDDLAETIASFAREKGTTYLLMGQPRRARPWERLAEPLPQRLLRHLPGVDLRIVVDRP